MNASIVMSPTILCLDYYICVLIYNYCCSWIYHPWSQLVHPPVYDTPLYDLLVSANPTPCMQQKMLQGEQEKIVPLVTVCVFTPNIIETKVIKHKHIYIFQRKGTSDWFFTHICGTIGVRWVSIYFIITNLRSDLK